jgi:chondroitin 4-sulfotransferase 11
VHDILKSLRLEASTIPHEKRSDRGPYQDYYDDESREIVAQLYSKDIETFGYTYN